MSIRLSKYSKNLISETFSMYQKKEWKWDEVLKIKGRCIIHLYPLKDTTYEDKKGELQVDGLQDSLFFTAKIFDCDNRIYYEKNHLHAFSTYAVQHSGRCLCIERNFRYCHIGF